MKNYNIILFKMISIYDLLNIDILCINLESE